MTAKEEMAAQMSPEVAKKFNYWSWRTILGTMMGYSFFYFVRKNFSIAIAMPGMTEDLGWTNTETGMVLTLFSIIYGIARFGNGILADRINGRYFMVAGLLGAALVNLFIGFTSSVLVLAAMWALNAWFQGMGFPACARLLTHWIHPKELATKMSIWNTSHTIGSSLVMIFCGTFLGKVLGLEWRYMFFLPALVSLTGAILLWLAIRDTPTSVGLPEIKTEGVEDSKHLKNSPEAKAEYKEYLSKHVFKNPYIWVLCAANFFVYIVRFGVQDWGPKLLCKNPNLDLGNSTLMVAGFEVAGLIGMLVAGYVTDRVFKGRGARTCVFCMAGTALFVTLFLSVWSKGNDMNILLASLFLAGAGFFIYGPQALVGIVSANMATKRAAASASGLTGTFGYASSLVSGVGIGFIMDTWGDNYVFVAIAGFAILGMLTFLFAWKAKAVGLTERTKK